MKKSAYGFLLLILSLGVFFLSAGGLQKEKNVV